MPERQRDRIAKAKDEGKYKEGLRLPAQNQIRRRTFIRQWASEIANQIGIGRASVYRILNSTHA